MRRRAAAWLAAVLVALPAAAPVRAEDAARAWALRLPSVEKVVFRGVVSFDDAGVASAQMLYPAPNAAGLLAAILTHGLITEGAKKAQKDKLQADADAVLEPYEPVLSSFTHERLFRAALDRLRAPGSRRLLPATEARGDDWLIETAPIFSMTRDQRGLVLDNIVRIHAPASADAALVQTIRVVSRAAPVGAADAASAVQPPDTWLADDGRRLIDESAGLFAESLDVAIGQIGTAGRPSEAPHKTFRYREGAIEKMERGQLVDERCARLVIRTLRGALLSVPSGAEPAGEGCAPAQRP